MTVVRVVDASAIAAVLFNEPEAEAMLERLRDGQLVAPSLLTFELVNVCLKKCRRHPELREVLRAALLQLGRLGIGEVAVDGAGVLELALETGLTAYDASYLWLARRLGGELITLDKALIRTAGALG